jgi:hypothetical protein
MLVFLTNKAICSDMIIASLFGTLAADASASESAVEKIVLVIITFLLTTYRRTVDLILEYHFLAATNEGGPL